MYIGHIITFNKNITDIECNFSPGIRGKIVYVNKHDEGTPDEHWEFLVDVSEFVEYNKDKWEANYYDDNHVPCLKYPETKHYKHRISVYLMPDDIKNNTYCTICDNVTGKLFYITTNKDGSNAKIGEITDTSNFPEETDKINQLLMLPEHALGFQLY